MASQAQGKVIFSADAIGFMRTANQVKGQMVEISGLGSGLKASLAGAFGAAMVAMAIKNMIDFADTTIKGANALDMTVRDFEALKILARDTGAEMEDLTGDINKMGAAAKNALEGNAKAMRGFRSFGISNEDLKNLKDFELLQKVMAGGQGMSRATEEANLRNLGIKNPSLIINAAPQLANFGQFAAGKEAAGQIANPEQQRQLQELKFQFDALTDTIKTHMVPILIWLIRIFDMSWMGLKMLGNGLLGAGNLIGWFATMLFDLGKFIKNIFTEGTWKAWKEYKQEVKVDTADTLNTIDARNQKLIDEQVKKNEAIDAKLAAFDADQADKGKKGGADREVTDQKVPEMGSNQFLKIGGLMGTDVDMKIMMINQQIENNTKRAAEALEKMAASQNNTTTGMKQQSSIPPH